ncbi:phage terminase small subunit P27 family [Hyphococcus flavus]|uniref:Phage terminase small subunit P27 family n=1 Tax=Hyphococcus flavus TaxID=1866326 RepID=A0AAF0CFZ0_9PROT|nr:phage terminase small subunit P27 family [Hyphococcus flavus]WDI31603.1 phage terminase small subunit P27 family [Hyphococcus flavus]
MAKRGPTPQPAAIKEAKGTSRRPIGKDPIAAVADQKAKVTKPSWMAKKKGGEIWDRLAPKLIRLKLLSDADVDTFARYCRNYQRWLDVNKFLDDNGTHYETETGYDRIRSAMMISLRLEPVLERTEDRFGLNPAERQRIFAARAAQGVPGDLFGAAGDGAKPPTQDKKPEAGERSPTVGFLN